jgi:hypothetical protein
MSSAFLAALFPSRRCLTEHRGEGAKKSGGFRQEFVKETSFRKRVTFILGGLQASRKNPSNTAEDIKSKSSSQSGFVKLHRKSALGQPKCSASSSALIPFHTICTPIHTKKKDDNCRITVIPVDPRIRASRSANP